MISREFCTFCCTIIIQGSVCQELLDLCAAGPKYAQKGPYTLWLTEGWLPMRYDIGQFTSLKQNVLHYGK